jgi:hypothetical protein
MEFPRCLYKSGPKGMEYLRAETPGELDSAVADGWCLTRADALAPNPAAVEPKEPKVSSVAPLSPLSDVVKRGPGRPKKPH